MSETDSNHRAARRLREREVYGTLSPSSVSSLKDVSSRIQGKRKNDPDDNFISSYRGARGRRFRRDSVPEVLSLLGTDISALSLSRLRS